MTNKYSRVAGSENASTDSAVPRESKKDRKMTLTEVLSKPYEVDWSYPTSDNASKFGFYRTGCWTVSKRCNPKPPQALAGFASREDALQYAVNRITADFMASGRPLDQAEIRYAVAA